MKTNVFGHPVRAIVNFAGKRAELTLALEIILEEYIDIKERDILEKTLQEMGFIDARVVGGSGIKVINVVYTRYVKPVRQDESKK